MLGKTLRGRYKITKQLGSRRFCDIYLAKDQDLPGQPLCVIKHLKPKDLEPLLVSTAKRLFTTEAEVLYRLGKHDQIPQLLAQFEENQEAYLVQEFVAGNELSEELTLGRRWNEPQVIALLQDILNVLAFIHQHNVIHRDLKPSNLIRRRQDGKIVLIDFGAAKQISPQLLSVLEHTGLTVGIGTPGYMPNEQANGNPKISSDIYSVGIICIQALTGMFPLQKDKNNNEISWRNQAKVSSKIADILDKMVSYDFEKRYQSVDEVLQALYGLPRRERSKPIKTSSRGLVFTIAGLFVGIASLVYITTLVQIPEFNKIFGRAKLKDSSAQLRKNISNGLLDYENNNEGIKIKYPGNWKKEEIQNPFTGEVAIFLAPKDNDADKFPGKVSIKIEDLSAQNMSLEEYTDSSLEEINKFLKDGKIIKSIPTKLSNEKAQMVVYTGKDEEDNLIKYMEVWTVKDKKAYIISYIAESDKYSQLLNSAEAMIKSFDFSAKVP
jgi:serine/threonine protein kinase